VKQPTIEFVISIDDEEFLAHDYYFMATVLYLDYAPFEDVIAAAEEAVSLDPSNEEFQEFLDKVTEEAEEESGSSSGSVYPLVTPVQTTKEDIIRFEGGDGSSLEEAVIILGATTEMEGIGAEDTWISERYGKRNTDWKKGGVELISEEGKKYDKYEVILSDGEEIIIWFDITDFFGSSLY